MKQQTTNTDTMITINKKYEGNSRHTEAEVMILGKKRNHKSELTPKEYAEMCDEQGWEIVSLTAVFPERKKEIMYREN